MSPLPHFVISLIFFFVTGVFSATFTVTNNCDYTVWPGILSGAGAAPLATTGFALQKGESRSVDVPASWSGRLWARTHCSTDSATGRFACVTGDCGSSSSLQCSGSGATPPATLAEFTLDGSGGLDFYDVSLVDGYNLPVLVAPSVRQCSSTGCLADLNPACPPGLKVVVSGSSGGGVACRRACEAFGSAEYCCSGEHGSPDTCGPSAYSRFFKQACPRAYSYAYDDATSTFTCGGGGDYAITFCPSSSSSSCQRSPQNDTNSSEAVGVSALANQTMVFFGGEQASVSAAPDASPFGVWLGLILGFLVSLR